MLETSRIRISRRDLAKDHQHEKCDFAQDQEERAGSPPGLLEPLPHREFPGRVLGLEAQRSVGWVSWSVLTLAKLILRTTAPEAACHYLLIIRTLSLLNQDT